MSLRARLVGATAAVALVALALAGVAAYSTYSRSQLRQIDESLQRAHEPIEDLVRTTPADLEGRIIRAAPSTFVAVIGRDGTVGLVVPVVRPGHQPSAVDPAGFAALSFDATDDADGDPVVYRTATSLSGDDRLRLRISRQGDGGLLLIGESLDEVDEARRRLAAILFVVAAAALVIATGVGWVLVRGGLRPLGRIERTARDIASGAELGQRAPGANERTEVGRLAGAMNTMLERIDSAFKERDEVEARLRDSEARMRRLVADVSHELRTPLAAVGAYAELLEIGAYERPVDGERAVRGISRESARMAELIEELLLLAQPDEGRPLARETVDLSALVAESVRTARSVADDFPVTLRVDDVVTVRGDALRLRQVVDNLLANVRLHNEPGTTASVLVRSEGSEAVITVADDGSGMTTDQVAHAFERFYRADSSRSRLTGGSGLGLSIVAAVVAAHHGDVQLASQPGEGVSVTVRLPRLSGEHPDSSENGSEGSDE